MSEQDRLKEIAKVAADAAQHVIQLSIKLSDQISTEQFIVLDDLTYQLGYIEGLSYVPEGEE